MINVQKLLDQYHFNLVKDMAHLLGVTPASNNKRGHVQTLVPVLFTPQAVEKGLSLLSERERAALAAIQRTGNRVDKSRLRAQLLRQGTIEPDKKKYDYQLPYSYLIFVRQEQRTSFAAVLGRLMASGLVCGDGTVNEYYTNRSKIYYDNVHYLYIPDPVKQLLPQPSLPQVAEFSIENLAHVAESSARAFQRDIYLYWSTARASPLSLTKEGRLYKKDLRLINNALLQPQDLKGKDEVDHPRLIFLRLLLTGLGLLEREDQTVRAVERPPFLGLEPGERIQRAFTHWRKGTFWNEVLSIPKVTPLGAGTRLDVVPKQIASARTRILDHIARLYKKRTQASSENEWTPLEQLIAEIRLTDYEFLLPRDYRPTASHYYHTYYRYTSHTSPYISYGNEMGWSFSPAFQDEAEGWEVVEAGFISAIVLEPLFWLGLVDIGFTQDRSLAYRLTSAGRWVLNVGREMDIPAGEGRVVIQPNFELYALDPISDLTLAELDEFADRVSAERVIKYVLTRESIYRAQRKGWNVERILDTLRELSDTPLPQNVMRTLKEWQSLHERVTIHRNASLLQAADDTLLDRLVQDPAIGVHLTTRPGQAVTLITPRLGEAESLIHILQKMGYPPARTQSPKDALRPSFIIDEHGQFHFHIALPSIYLYEQIAPFTGRDEQGRYYLTQSAVQGALERGLGIDGILKRLRALHLGSLPRWVEIQVRAWGHYYGHAAVQTITLVQLKDDKTCRELLAEPELKGILRPFAPAEDKALAIVSTEDLERLYELLAERGITFQDQLDE
jgi:hypothetical protein